MVEANGAARELLTKGYRYIFTVLSTSDQYLTPAIDLAAGHAEELGKTPETLTVALAIEHDSFAQDVRAGVLADVERHGMRCVIDDQLPPELNDMSVTLAKVKALRPDVLVISGPREGGAHCDQPDQGLEGLRADPRHGKELLADPDMGRLFLGDKRSATAATARRPRRPWPRKAATPS
jgi:hypothetical protein